jgi:predicted TIM-barrel fold metal-dependent hydrolase
VAPVAAAVAARRAGAGRRGDPRAFFEPLDRHNERLEELVANPQWWFGSGRYPTFDQLLESLESLVRATPATTYIAAHAGAAEDLAWVDRMLTSYPNFHVDLGGRIGELGRRPRATRRLVEAHPDRVLFGTDGRLADAPVTPTGSAT